MEVRTIKITYLKGSEEGLVGILRSLADDFECGTTFEDFNGDVLRISVEDE